MYRNNNVREKYEYDVISRFEVLNMEGIKQVVTNKKIKLVFAICVTLWMVIFAQIAITKMFAVEKDITEAFATSDDVKISGCEVDATATLLFLEDGLEDNAKKILSESINAITGDSKEYTIKTLQKNTCFKITQSTKEYDMYATVTWSEELQHTYFHMNISIRQDIELCNQVKKRIEEVLDGYTKEYFTFIKMEAYKAGNSTIEECSEYASEIFGRLNAVSVSVGEGNVYTEYGYSKELTNTIKSEDKSVNVQVSFGYNEVMDVTEISVGYPIINSSY